MNCSGFLLGGLLAWGLATGAHAALGDELNEVNRLYRAGRSDAALARADRYLADHPKDAQMRFLKGVMLAETGRRDEAIALLLRLAEDYPELAEPYNNLAALYAAAGDYARARAMLQEALRVNPQYAAAHENLGDVYAALAGRSYAEALRLEPAAAGVAAKLALVREIGKPPGASTARGRADAPSE